MLIHAVGFVCASPFLLLLLLFLLRDRIDEFIGATRSRQAFKQNLEAATLNPADASAHYQLGLIYQKRGEQDAAEAVNTQEIAGNRSDGQCAESTDEGDGAGDQRAHAKAHLQHQRQQEGNAIEADPADAASELSVTVAITV